MAKLFLCGKIIIIYGDQSWDNIRYEIGKNQQRPASGIKHLSDHVVSYALISVHTEYLSYTKHDGNICGIYFSDCAQNDLIHRI